MNPLRWWRQRTEARVLRQRAIPDALWLSTLQQQPFLRHRSLADLEQLRRLSTLFLDRKEFTAVGDLVLTDAMAVSVAAQACVPILHLGLDCYDGFKGIVLQPDEVVVQREWQDEDGVVHSGEDLLVGEAMPGGPVMLSWPEVRDAGLHAHSGYNVVIHEFVHVLDMLDGLEADGMPPLPSRQAQTHWQAVLQAALNRLQVACEEEQDSWLDPYAAHGPQEYFAVSAEAFFVAPQGLLQHEPTVYHLLKDYFAQDPARHAPAHDN